MQQIPPGHHIVILTPRHIVIPTSAARRDLGRPNPRRAALPGSQCAARHIAIRQESATLTPRRATASPIHRPYLHDVSVPVARGTRTAGSAAASSMIAPRRREPCPLTDRRTPARTPRQSPCPPRLRGKRSYKFL